MSDDEEKNYVTMVCVDDEPFGEWCVDECIKLNNIIRESAHPLFQGIRSVFESSSYDLDEIVFADLYDDDQCCQYGIFVNAKNQVIEFDYWYLASQPEVGRLEEVNDITVEEISNEIRAAKILLDRAKA